MVCAACGTENSAGRKFCGGCAAPLERLCPACCAAPAATEDDAERAVRAALDLVTAVSALGDELGSPLHARAGVEAREGFEQLQAGPWIERIRRVQATAETVNA
jgi:hypothetical protein